jgi:hypothetical protein
VPGAGRVPRPPRRHETGRDVAPLHRGIAAAVARADNMLMLVLLAAAALLGGSHTIAGTITANTGTTVTVSSNDRSLTCAVVGEKGQTAILRWGTGVRAAMQCRKQGDRLVLARLTRLGSKEPEPSEPTTTTEPAKPSVQMLTVGGTVVSLTGDGVALNPDRGGALVRCAITAAADSQTARASLTVGAHVGIACRLDGGRYVLAYAKPVTEPKTTTPTTTTEPPKPPVQMLTVGGTVVTLTGDGVTLKPDRGGELVKCSITPAADSQTARAALTVGAHVGIACRLDGGRYVLAYAKPIS